MEKARQEARGDIQEGRARVKALTAERTKLNQNLGEIQERLGKVEEREDEARKEAYALRQKVIPSFLFRFVLYNVESFMHFWCMHLVYAAVWYYE